LIREPLQFISCGSVDDGKSTLIGRLLWEANQVFEDHVALLKAESPRYGTQLGELDFALLLDGLQAEREQNITIDVAYRFFGTSHRRFIVADCPGHEQYTRNMATGASHSNLGLLVVDASKGLSTQTYRHLQILALFGVRDIVLAVNKMDMVGWSEAIFRETVSRFDSIVVELGLKSFQAIPTSALHGDNVKTLSTASPWYRGTPLLTYLEEVDIFNEATKSSFRMPVQYVNRPDQAFRGYSGRIASGHVKIGDRVRVVPGGQVTIVRSIIASRTEQPFASAGESTTLLLEDHIDVPRGSVICSVEDPVESCDQFEVVLLSLLDFPLVPDRNYIVRMHTNETVALKIRINARLDVCSGTCVKADSLLANDIAFAHLQMKSSVPFDIYQKCRQLGSMILIDPISNETVCAGIIKSALRRSEHIYWQAIEISKSARSERLLQKPKCFWFTGLPASGKSTIANLLEKHLFSQGRYTYLLDGDNVRHGLNRDLGFSDLDRAENVRRLAEVARLFVDAGLIVIVSLISPRADEREFARSLFERGEFVEVFVDAPLEECERRDPKGLYRKARSGEIINLTGLDGIYERPQHPDFHINTLLFTPGECVQQILTRVSRAL